MQNIGLTPQSIFSGPLNAGYLVTNSVFISASSHHCHSPGQPQSVSLCASPLELRHAPQGRRVAVMVPSPPCVSLCPGILVLECWLPLLLSIALKQLEFFVCLYFAFYFTLFSLHIDSQQENWVSYLFFFTTRSISPHPISFSIISWSMWCSLPCVLLSPGCSVSLTCKNISWAVGCGTRISTRRRRTRAGGRAKGSRWKLVKQRFPFATGIAKRMCLDSQKKLSGKPL